MSKGFVVLQNFQELINKKNQFINRNLLQHVSEQQPATFPVKRKQVKLNFRGRVLFFSQKSFQNHFSESKIGQDWLCCRFVDLFFCAPLITKPGFLLTPSYEDVYHQDLNTA